MKKIHSLLIILVALVSFVWITQAMAVVCETAPGGCGKTEGKACVRKDTTRGVCTDVLNNDDVPVGCYCRLDQLTLLPIGMFPDITTLTLQEAYQMQAEPDQLQDDVDDHIMDLEFLPTFQPVLTK